MGIGPKLRKQTQTFETLKSFQKCFVKACRENARFNELFTKGCYN